MQVAFWYNVAGVVLNLFAVWFLSRHNGNRKMIALNLGAAAISTFLALVCLAHM